MKKRIIAAAVLGSLLATVPAAADRRRRVAQVKEEVEVEDQDGPEATSVLGIKIDDLIEVAVRLSPELARSRQDRASAKGQAVAARKDQQWVLTAGANFERFSTDPENSVGPFNTASENKLNANLGIGRNLPTGGFFGVELGVQRVLRELEIPAGILQGRDANGNPLTNGMNLPITVDGNAAVPDEYTVHQAQAKVTFKQPLARGFGSKIALAAEKKGDLAATEATVKTQIAAEEMIRDIVIGYWELAYAAHEVDTRAHAIVIAKEQERVTQNQYRVDMAAKNAISAVQYELAVREEALLDAKNQYEKKSLELRRKVGLELSRRDIVMRPLEKFAADDDEFDIEDVLAASRKSNRRVAALILQKRQADIDVTVAKNAMLPQIDLSLSGALVGSGETADRAFTGATNGGNFVVTAGLTVQFEIGGAAKGAHDAALARRSRIEVDQVDVQRTLDTEVVHAVHQVTSARARVALAEKAELIGEENVTSERASFSAGRSTNFDVMQRQTELITARIRKGRAIADYHIAVAQVQFHGGMLLQQYRVDVRPVAKK